MWTERVCHDTSRGEALHSAPCVLLFSCSLFISINAWKSHFPPCLQNRNSPHTPHTFGKQKHSAEQTPLDAEVVI